MLDQEQFEKTIPSVLAEIESDMQDSGYIYAETIARGVMVHDESALRRHRIASTLLKHIGINLPAMPNVDRYVKSKPFRGALTNLVDSGLIELEYEQISGLPLYRETFTTPDIDVDAELNK